MIHENLEKTDSKRFNSFLNAAQKFYIHIQQTPNYNGTINISALVDSDEYDGPDPLRIPEVLIVICVLLLWCISIFIFIRHSELLRIRHRDLPYHSTAKPSMSLNHITVVNPTSDMIINSKSYVSSLGGLTPPNHMLTGRKNVETIESISLSISPISGKRRRKPSFDLNASLSTTKNSFDKHDDKEQLLDKNRISTDIQRGLPDFHRTSMDNLLRKSMDNLFSLKYPTFYSANDMTNHRQNVSRNITVKKQYIQESPV